MSMWKANGFAFLVIMFVVMLARSVEWANAEPAKVEEFAQAINQANRSTKYEGEQTAFQYLGDKVRSAKFFVKNCYPYCMRKMIDGPEGSRRVILEDGQSVWTYIPDKKVVLKEAIESSEFALVGDVSPKDATLLARNYELVVRGPVHVDGGMACDIAEFRPREKDRPIREIWIEEKSKLPVRVYLSSPDGRPVYRTELRKIRWNPDFESDAFKMEVPRDTRVFEVRKRQHLTVQEAEQLLNRPVVFPVFIPDGYVPRDIVFRMEEMNKRLQLIYSDGLSSFSIFEEWPVRRVAGKDAAEEPPCGPPSTQSAGIAGIRDTSRTAIPATAGTASREGSSPAHAAGRGPAPQIYRYGLITVISSSHDGFKTVLVGDVPEDRLLDVFRSMD